MTNRDDVEPVVEVGAEALLLDRLLEIGVRRRDEPHVDLDRRRAADGDDLALLEDAQQLHLDRERRLADLVEEERAAARDLEHAVLVADRAREAPLHVAEELALEQVLRQRAAVDRDERGVRPAAPVVDRLRDELLARAALAAR